MTVFHPCMMAFFVGLHFMNIFQLSLRHFQNHQWKWGFYVFFPLTLHHFWIPSSICLWDSQSQWKKNKVDLDRNYIVAQKASSSLTVLRVFVLCDLDVSSALMLSIYQEKQQRKMTVGQLFINVKTNFVNVVLCVNYTAIKFFRKGKDFTTNRVI